MAHSVASIFENNTILGFHTTVLLLINKLQDLAFYVVYRPPAQVFSDVKI